MSREPIVKFWLVSGSRACYGYVFSKCAKAQQLVSRLCQACLALGLLRAIAQLAFFNRWQAKNDKNKKAVNLWLYLIPRAPQPRTGIAEGCF